MLSSPRIKNLSNVLSIALLLGLGACSAITPLSASQTSQQSAASQASKADLTFTKVMNAQWRANLAYYPSYATTLGVRDYDQQLHDPSLEAYDKYVQQQSGFLANLDAIDQSQLSSRHQLNYSLLRLQLQDEIESAQYGGRYLNITNRDGPHQILAYIPSQLPFFNKADFNSYLSRLLKMSAFMHKATNRSRQGIVAGWLQPCDSMQGYEHSISALLVDNAENSAWYEPFTNKPSSISDDDFATMQQQAKTIIKESIMPAITAFEKFYLEEYLPNCRTTYGTNEMTGGEDYYAYLIRHYTTTDQTPEQVHQTGLSEVARIHQEMLNTIKESGFKGSFEQWLEYLRTDKSLYPKTGEERFMHAALISKKMDGLLPKLFGRLPRMPYGLKEIPLANAEKTTTAYYNEPAGDGTRAGMYFLNTTLLDTRPLYQLEALSLHEAVPGHHLQIALAQELDLPPFRKYGGQTVFIEGWGLYAERLGLEVGFYQTPLTNFGRLSYEMWRACRLVVDTGLHAKGWTRQQAIDYMNKYSGLSLNNITTEVDRYITWPGQAVAYKTGELKIRELRTKAEAQLGEKFDIRQFHDKVLENGAIPLSVLEQHIEKWLKTQSDAVL